MNRNLPTLATMLAVLLTCATLPARACPADDPPPTACTNPDDPEDTSCAPIIVPGIDNL